MFSLLIVYLCDENNFHTYFTFFLYTIITTTYLKGFYMKKTFLALGTLALLASPSLFAVDAAQVQTILQTQQRLQNGTGMGGKKQYKHQYKYQHKYQGANGNKMQGNGNPIGTGQGKGQGNAKGNMYGTGQGKGQGNMSGMGQGKGNKGGQGMRGNGGNKGGSGMRGGKGGSRGGGGGGKR